MKADRDDAPEYLRTKKQGPWRMLVVLGVGSAITWTLIALFAKPIVIDVNQIKQGIRIGGQSLFSQQPNERYSPPAQVNQETPAPFEPAEQVPRPPLSQAEIEWFEENEALAIERSKNIFNDKNYKPKQPQNTYSPPTYKQVASSQSASQSSSRGDQHERDGQWIDKWSGGARYFAEWEIFNNYIDGTSVCANHRRGSIDYRECRKGAKQFFKKQCQAWGERYQSDRKDWSYRMKQRYCSAGSNFNPMG